MIDVRGVVIALRDFDAKSQTRRAREIHPGETWITHACQIACGDRIDSYAVDSVRLLLQEWDRVRMKLDVFEQVFLVACFCEKHLFVPRGEARQIVNLLSVQANQVTFRVGAE